MLHLGWSSFSSSFHPSFFCFLWAFQSCPTAFLFFSHFSSACSASLTPLFLLQNLEPFFQCHLEQEPTAVSLCVWGHDSGKLTVTEMLRGKYSKKAKFTRVLPSPFVLPFTSGGKHGLRASVSSHDLTLLWEISYSFLPLNKKIGWKSWLKKVISDRNEGSLGKSLPCTGFFTKKDRKTVRLNLTNTFHNDKEKKEFAVFYFFVSRL